MRLLLFPSACVIVTGRVLGLAIVMGIERVLVIDISLDRVIVRVVVGGAVGDGVAVFVFVLLRLSVLYLLCVVVGVVVVAVVVVVVVAAVAIAVVLVRVRGVHAVVARCAPFGFWARSRGSHPNAGGRHSKEPIAAGNTRGRMLLRSNSLLRVPTGASQFHGTPCYYRLCNCPVAEAST